LSHLLLELEFRGKINPAELK